MIGLTLIAQNVFALDQYSHERLIDLFAPWVRAPSLLPTLTSPIAQVIALIYASIIAGCVFLIALMISQNRSIKVDPSRAMRGPHLSPRGLRALHLLDLSALGLICIPLFRSTSDALEIIHKVTPPASTLPLIAATLICITPQSVIRWSVSPFFGGVPTTSTSALHRQRSSFRMILSALCALLGVFTLSLSGEFRDFIQERRTPLSPILSTLKTWTDGDGDGASGLFGEDCDDADPRRAPHMLERAQDGIDQDCDGQDGEARSSEIQQTSQELILTSEDRPPAPHGVLLITVDTLRPDRLFSRHGDRKVAPRIVNLSDHALNFTRAYSPANVTRHAIPALLGGRSFNQLNLRRAGLGYQLTEESPHLFKSLKRSGYQTEGHLPAYIKRYWPSYEDHFDHYVGYGSAHSLRAPLVAPEITDGVLRSIDRLARSGEPWALWVHYAEPHEPYVCHHRNFGTEPLDCYDTEIEKIDHSVGRLLDALDRLKLRNTTLVALTSDHGEEFGEHGGRFHGKTLFEETIRVPLILAVPSLSAQRINTPVSALHLRDFIEQIAHIQPLAPHPWHPLLISKPITSHDLFIDAIRHNDHPLRRSLALIRWPWKATLDLERSRLRLYDLKEDPEERSNAQRAHPMVAQELKATLIDHHRRELKSERAWIQRTFVRPLKPSEWTEKSSEETPLCAQLSTALKVCALSITRAQVAHRQHLTLTLEWRVYETISEDYQVRLEWTHRPRGERESRALPSKGKRSLHDRKYTPFAGRYPTSLWERGQRLIDAYKVNVPNRHQPICPTLTLYKGDRVRSAPVELIIAECEARSR